MLQAKLSRVFHDDEQPSDVRMRAGSRHASKTPVKSKASELLKKPRGKREKGARKKAHRRLPASTEAIIRGGVGGVEAVLGSPSGKGGRDSAVPLGFERSILQNIFIRLKSRITLRSTAPEKKVKNL